MTGTPELSAIVALDVTAQVGVHMGVLWALHTLRKRVPENLCVVCFTAPAVAEWTIPKLTSVELPFVAIGPHRCGADAEATCGQRGSGADFAAGAVRGSRSTARPDSRS